MQLNYDARITKENVCLEGGYWNGPWVFQGQVLNGEANGFVRGIIGSGGFYEGEYK